jgi:16S rRNA processing protein RimM
MAMPDDLVELGRVVSAYGVRGWLKVQPQAAGGDGMLACKSRWLRPPVAPGAAGNVLPPARLMEVAASRPQGATVVAQLEAVPDRDVAESFKGHTVWVSRSDFPPSGEDEYYWVDLIGCRLYGEHDGQPRLIGLVRDVLDNSAHAILRVERYAEDASEGLQPLLGPKGKPLEELVPFVSAHVHTVDLANKRLDSDWPVEY